MCLVYVSAFLYLKHRGDFSVMFPGAESEFNASVFYLLENACLELAKVSYNLQKRVADGQMHSKHTGSRAIYYGFVYSRMLWGEYTHYIPGVYVLVSDAAGVQSAESF